METRVQRQYISLNIGDMEAVFSGNFPLREVKDFENIDSYLHSHTNFELHYVTAGNCNIIAEEKYTLKTGDIMLIPPEFPHTSSNAENRRLVLELSFLKNEGVTSNFSEYKHYTALFATVKKPFIFRSENAEFCLKSLMTLYDNDFFVHKQKILLSMLFIHISEHITTPRTVPTDKLLSGYIQSDDQRRLIIENYINNCYSHTDSLDELCQQLNLSRRQIDRITAGLFGESYQTMILKRRMEAALLMINKTDMPFSQIAEKVGYESYAGFYLAVKRVFGKSPEELRNQNKISQ